MIIGSIIIQKIHYSNGKLCYISFKDLEDPGYEYREYSDGTKEWHRNGKIHREDGPAVIYSDGSKEWWTNDHLHREGGPAMIYEDGSEIWYKNGKYHREDGPAIIWKGGDIKYFLEGEYYSEEEFKEKIKKKNDSNR